MATRAVNKTAKEGEQNARLLLSRGALSAMAIFRRGAFPSVRRWRCTAPYPLLAPAAPALCLSCFWRGRSPSPAFGAIFLRGGRQLFGAGRIRAFVYGKIFANAFSGDWQWQYTRAVRSQASIRSKIPPRCVPRRPSVAIFALHASQKRPRTGKSPVRGKIRVPRIRKRAGSGKICALCIRKAPQTAFRERTARRSCQEGPLFAARAPRIMHGAQILPSAVAPNRPSARNPGAAEQRELPELDRPAQETQPGGSAPVASWAASTASSSLGTATALCQHQPVACARRTTLSLPTAPPVETASTPPPPRRFAELCSPKGGPPSLLAAPVFCALGRCDRLINARRSPFYAIISLWLRKNRHPSGKTQALPIQWVGCSRGHVPYRTINKEKRLRWQLLHIALSARKRRKW